MPLKADTTSGPKLILWESIGYTVTCTVFDPPIFTLGGVAQNRAEPLPDWFACYRRLGDFTQDFLTYKANGTEEYFDNAAFTEENYNRAKAAQEQEPSKETLLYAIVIKNGTSELLVLSYLDEEWTTVFPEDRNKIVRSIFRREAGGSWKAHTPKESEQWYRLFPVFDHTKLAALVAAQSIEKGVDGVLKPVMP